MVGERTHKTILSHIKLNMWVVSRRDATLSDYLAMVVFMSEEFVSEAFVIYSHAQTMIQLCFQAIGDDELDVASWFPTYNVVNYNYFKLDQPLTIEGCMLMGMTMCDLVHTKNLSNTRGRLGRQLGLTMTETSVLVEKGD